MAHDHGQGIFEFSFISRIAVSNNIELAKREAHERIEASSATQMNKTKATGMVNKCRSIKDLLLGMSNFSLSHQGLRSIR